MKRILNFFRYDFPIGIKNLIRFFPIIWVYRDFDYSFSLALFGLGLQQLKKCLKNGMEVDETRLPKVDAIEKALRIFDNIIRDDYLALAERQLGYEYNTHYPIGKSPTDVEKCNRKLSEYSRELEEKEWIVLRGILFGDKGINGSDMRGWWD